MPLSFDDLAAQFDDQRGLPAEALRAFVAFVGDLSPGATLDVIEPGIGTGRLALPLLSAGHRVTGVDISRPMLDSCARKAASLRLDGGLTLLEGDATDLPAGDDAFDLGIFASLLYLVPDWEAVLDELARVVHPGGWVMGIRERTEQDDALALWDRTWREMVEGAGFAHAPMTPGDEALLEAFRRRWGESRIQELTAWPFGQSVREARADYGARLRALYPQIDDETWTGLVTDFLDWASDEFTDPDETLGGDVVLEAIVATV